MEAVTGGRRKSHDMKFHVFVPTKDCSTDQTKEEIGGARDTYGVEKKCLYFFGREI
jgi:hypothetical protein